MTKNRARPGARSKPKTSQINPKEEIQSDMEKPTDTQPNVPQPAPFNSDDQPGSSHILAVPKPAARPVSGRRPPSKPLKIQIKTYDVPTADLEKVSTTTGEDHESLEGPKMNRGPNAARMPIIPQGGVNLRKVDRKEPTVIPPPEVVAPAFVVKLRATGNADRLKEPTNEKEVGTSGSASLPIPVPIAPTVSQNSQKGSTKQPTLSSINSPEEVPLFKQTQYSGRPPAGPPPPVPTVRTVQPLNLNIPSKSDTTTPKLGSQSQTTREPIMSTVTTFGDDEDTKENNPWRGRSVSADGEKKTTIKKEKSDKEKKKKGFILSFHLGNRNKGKKTKSTRQHGKFQ